MATARTRYMIRVRKVKGGGSRESGSKNWMARYSRAYLRSGIVAGKYCSDLLPLGVQGVVDLPVGDREHDYEYSEEHHADEELVDHPHGHHGSL